MMENQEYVGAVRRALTDNPQVVRQWLTFTCPECDNSPDEDDPEHVMLHGFVIVGCEGYHVVNPNVLGFDRPDWNDWLEVLE